MTLICKRSGKYTNLIRKFKWNDTGSRKCECLIKFYGYLMSNNTWRFNVICGIYNYDMCRKLADHPISCRLKLGENELISNISLHIVQPKKHISPLK